MFYCRIQLHFILAISAVCYSSDNANEGQVDLDSNLFQENGFSSPYSTERGPGKGSRSREERWKNKLKRRKGLRQERKKNRRKNRNRGYTSQPSLSSNIPLQFPVQGIPNMGQMNPVHDVYEGRADKEMEVEPFGLPNLQTNHQPNLDMAWLQSNITSIWFTLHHIQKEFNQIRRQFRQGHKTRSKKGSSSVIDASTDEPCDPQWETHPDACLDERGSLCGGNGRCSCGQCLCNAPFYGVNCQCNDMTCDSYGGILCGGAGRGQCRCGACVCRSQFSGSDCGCSLSTSECQNSSEEICSGQGVCDCNRCQCNDGYTGKFCDESIYSATVCERLKPCVLCLAFGRQYPQCEECNIRIHITDKLVSSRATCFMVNLGSILKYSYVTPDNKDEGMIVLVEKDRSKNQSPKDV